MIKFTIPLAVAILTSSIMLETVYAQDQSQLTSDNFRFLGIARAKQYATLRVPKQGLVQSIFVKEGQQVTSGERLLSLDDRIPQAALALAGTEANNVAAIKISKIERDRLAIAFERAQAGFQQNAVGQFELDAKRSEYNRAIAAYEMELEKRAQSLARLKMAEQEVASMSLLAPFDGSITEIHANVGDAIGPSENAITIANLDLLEIEIYLPLSLYGRIEQGKEYQIQASQPVSTRLSVLASYVSPEIESTSGTFRAVFIYNNRQTRYPTGFEIYFVNKLDSRAQ